MPDFTAISQLRIRQLYEGDTLFSQCSSMEDLLKELFETTNRGQIFVWDDKRLKHSVFLEDSQGKGVNRILKVENVDHRDLFLWHIDGVMFQRGSKCDCALINESHLNFVEFKSEAVNRTPLQAQGEYQKASDQIETVLTDFLQRAREKHVDLHLVKIGAIAVFNRTVPRYNASQKMVKRRFEKRYKIPFDFVNEVKM